MNASTSSNGAPLPRCEDDGRPRRALRPGESDTEVRTVSKNSPNWSRHSPSDPSIFTERRLRADPTADVRTLLEDVYEAPVEEVGAKPIDDFLPERERTSLMTALNTLLASPTFESWRRGAALDVREWMMPEPDGSSRPPSSAWRTSTMSDPSCSA